jgi:hypothetical protein
MDETSRPISPSLGREVPRTSEAEIFYISTVDSWRAIAVSVVIAGHSNSMLMNNGSARARSLALFLTRGGYGVDIFFALSGYLICTLLLYEKRENYLPYCLGSMAEDCQPQSCFIEITIPAAGTQAVSGPSLSKSTSMRWFLFYCFCSTLDRQCGFHSG